MVSSGNQLSGTGRRNAKLSQSNGCTKGHIVPRWVASSRCEVEGNAVINGDKDVLQLG